jgi:multidrug efflux pump subunit AcrA (membrane-fusion protein)
VAASHLGRFQSPPAAEGVIKAMFLTKVRFASFLLLVLAGIAAGVGALTQRVPASQCPVIHVDEKPAKVVIKQKSIRVVSPSDGIIMVVGTEKPGEIIPKERIIAIRSGNKTRTFKKLKEGDLVDVEQVVARLDDRLALNEVERARTKLAAAKLDLEVSKKTSNEADLRYQIALKAPKGTFSVEELREKKLVADKFKLEVQARKEAVNLALLDIRQAEIILDMHVIRSPVRGWLRVIFYNRGEAVKALDPILEIVPMKE